MIYGAGNFVDNFNGMFYLTEHNGDLGIAVLSKLFHRSRHNFRPVIDAIIRNVTVSLLCLQNAIIVVGIATHAV